MKSEDVPFEYITAEGPEELRKVLDDLMEKTQKDPELEKEHYVLYQLGSQKSFIKVDMSENPVLFWYCDLLGRPATRIVRKTIADFLWEKCGEEERYLQELASRK